jgi:hypothetical protein
VLVAAALVTGLEVAARVTPIPRLRAAEGAAVAIAAAIGTVRAIRARPPEGAWLWLADALAPEPGVFSAACGGAPATRLGPLVALRAEACARALLAAPPAPRRPGRLPRAAAAAAAAAIVTMVLPGRAARAGGDGPGEMQARVIAEIRALARDAGRSGDPAQAAAIARASAAIERDGLTPDAARQAAEDLLGVARSQEDGIREIADGLARLPAFDAVADALRRRDEVALKAALEALSGRVRALESRGPEALQAAAGLLGLAAREHDAALRQALADAGQALSSGSGSDASEGIGRLGAPLAKVLRESKSFEDVVVALDAAARPGAPGAGRAPRTVTRGDTTVDPAGEARHTRLPDPGDFRALVRPGTSDEAVLRRYFAIP